MAEKTSREVMFGLLEAVHKNMPKPDDLWDWDKDESPILEILKKETETNEFLGADEVFGNLKKLVADKETTAGALMLSRMAGDFCLGIALDCRDLASNRSDILASALRHDRLQYEDSLATLVDKVEEQTA